MQAKKNPAELAGSDRAVIHALDNEHNSPNPLHFSTAARWLSRRYALRPEVAEVIAAATGLGGTP